MLLTTLTTPSPNVTELSNPLLLSVPAIFSEKEKNAGAEQCWLALTRPFVRRATPVKISSSNADGIRAVGVDQTLKSRPTGSLPYPCLLSAGKGLIVSLSWCKISNNSRRFLPKAGLGPVRVARKRFCSNVGSPTLFPPSKLPTFSPRALLCARGQKAISQCVNSSWNF